MMKTVMGINTICFTQCINSFKEDKLTANEIACVKSCSARQEQSMRAMQDIQEGIMQKTGTAHF